MITVDEALRLIREKTSTIDEEAVSLANGNGRILTDPVRARLTQPPFDGSAMDGYAVRYADAIKAGAQLNVTGESAAGKRFNNALSSSEAVRIFTGAPMPDGADTVVIQENTSRDGDRLIINIPPKPGQHIRKAGNDFAEGDVLLDAGQKLDGPALALAAAGNVTSLNVRRKPRVAMIANGDELIMPGESPGPDEIISSIPFGLAPMILDWGGEPEFLGVARDDPAELKSLINKAEGYDVIVPIGGASVGDRDFMKPVFRDLGFQSFFEKVAMRPGKPAWFGRLNDARIMGLPGNPASAFATAIVFLKPLLCRLLGAEPDGPISAHLTQALSANGERESYLRGRLSDEIGKAQLTPFSRQDSALLSVFAKSNVLIRRPANSPAADKGDLIECIRI